MKKYLSILFMLFLGISMNAKPLSINVDTSLDELILNKNQIMYNGLLLGKFQIQSEEINANNKQKVKVYHVKIFCNEGKEVAKYELQLNGKPKKNSRAIIDATLKTNRDNVNHNPSNFLDYNSALSLEKEESEIVQFEKVVKYLLSYKYL